VSWWARGWTDAIGKTMGLQWNNTPDDVIPVAVPTLRTSGWERYVYRIRWRTTTPEGGSRLYLDLLANVTNATLDLDAVQVEEGERETAYAPGTWDAEADVAAALATLAEIASDGLLTPVEKPVVIRDWTVITSENAGIAAQASAAGVSAVAYGVAFSALGSYLDSLTTPVAWDNLTGNTTIVGATFRTKFSDYYTAKQAVLDAISAVKAKTDLSNVANGSVRINHVSGGCACTVGSGSGAPSFSNVNGFASAAIETSADGFRVLRLNFSVTISGPYQVWATIVNDDGATHPNNYSIALKTETALSTRCRLQLVSGITRLHFDDSSYNRQWYITVVSL